MFNFFRRWQNENKITYNDGIDDDVVANHGRGTN